MELKDATILHTQSLTHWVNNDIHYFLDGEAPNWVATDTRGSAILHDIDGHHTFGELVAAYQSRAQVDGTVAWLHTHEFCQGLLRQQLIADAPRAAVPYVGRHHYLEIDRLDECWFQVNDECNLACRHCLVESSPKGKPGLPTVQLARLIDEAAALGAKRLYFTGGEPFMRTDVCDQIHRVIDHPDTELIILTNALKLTDATFAALADIPHERLKFQVSIDGASAATNDFWRGKGTFANICNGARAIADAGFDVSLTTVVTTHNLHEIALLPAVVKEVGGKSFHLMWPHRRGRLTVGQTSYFPSCQALIGLVHEVAQTAREAHVEFDNVASMQVRVNGLPYMRFDLSNAGWGSVCVGPDGHLYPSPALCEETAFDCGNAVADGIETHWKSSTFLQQLREHSLTKLPPIADDPMKYMIGGGDIDHALHNDSDKQIGGMDGYYPVYQDLAKRVMHDLAENKRSVRNTRSGYNPPPIYHAMGDGAIASPEVTVLPCPDELVVSTLHSNCVLSFDVDKPRQAVQQFYGRAAETPQQDLCCPVKYDADATAHIPAEVMERFYGCGSPSTMAQLQTNEVYLDLGSGGGIDCFIAAKQIGPEGKAIGVDMTDQMLAVANRNRALVAARLGYDNCDFRKGYLEKIPVDDTSVDCITSNCVINLSPDKKAVFREMWRVLKNHGRIVIADIVSEQPLPPALRANDHLWGECLSGALTQDAFLANLEETGFYGLEVIKRDYWKTVESYPFYSVTVRGYRFAKGSACQFLGQHAIYMGPGKTFVDEEGHLFPRNVAIEVCTDTAAKLRADPYRGSFMVIDPDTPVEGQTCCSSDERTPCC